ncbi:MAG: hypothetical protein J1F16_03820 [Muribaculaceae bacterium]|nr:hypothetical protein [Muribaculaceae bacterium]
MLGKKKFFIYLLLGILPFCVGCKHSSNDSADGLNEPDQPETVNRSSQAVPVRGVRSLKVRNIGPLGKVFNDSNYVHLESAKKMGIEPISGLSSAYFTKRPIVKVQSNKYYHIDSLRHSLPYLVPEAASLLEVIGRNFIDSLHNRGGDSYKIKVTSLLRTPESVGRLRRVNINATDSSTHQFATTFDISYTNFYCTDETRQINQGDLKNLLGEVLLDLKKQGKCLVKYEYKTGCFHVTVKE